MRGIIRSLLVALWFMALTFPIMVIKVVTLEDSSTKILWRLENMVYVGVGIFFLSFIWRAMLVKKGMHTPEEANLEWFFSYFSVKKNRQRGIALLALLPGLFAAVLMLAALLQGDAGMLTSSGLVTYGLTVLGSVVLGIMILSGQGEKLYTSGNELVQTVLESNKAKNTLYGLLLLGLALIPLSLNLYQLNVMTSALIWVMLGLGLNIVVGQAGLLVLGYVAFYAVGAYSYAVCNQYFAGPLVGFWVFLPLGGFLALLAGVVLSLPVLRLRGDYLAIVTLGFGEIVRITLEVGSLSLEPFISLLPKSVAKSLPSWMHGVIDLGGPAGIANIPAPGFFGMSLNMDQRISYIYYVALLLTVLTIFSVSRLRDSRIGRSWMALREDEIACEAMGINKVVTKLSAFALGACWAGFGGVLFAAKTSFINPTSFTFMESALILSVVVLGGLGSIAGVILGACILILLPEYLRAIEEYRMLIFGASMVLMMVFRPQGLITPKPKRRVIDPAVVPDVSHDKAATI